MSRTFMCLDCGALTDQSRCPIHRKTTNRGYGTEHQTMLRVAISLHPYCHGCGCPVTQCRLQLHHVEPLQGGRNPDTDDRRQLLCKKCHNSIKEK